MKNAEPQTTTPDLSPVEKRIIYHLSGDLGDDARPYEVIGRKIGLSEGKIIEVIGRLAEEGYLRRLGATLRHQRSGFKANAMVAWHADEGALEEAGHRLAAFPEVTHCYQRRTIPGWNRNLYTMIHASSEEECHWLARRMSEACGLDDYVLLFSHEELKKTSMRYFE